MRKIFKVISICLITIFSFYYTHLVVNLIKNKDPIMQEIKNYKKQVEVVNGIISNNTLLVGTSGKKINANKSYQKMKTVKTFNKELLEYINIKPEITKSNNLDKLIIGKNTTLKELSFVFKIKDIDSLKEIVYILNNNDISATFFIDLDLLENNLFEIKDIINDNSVGIYNSNNIIYEKKLLVKNFNNNYANYCLYSDDTFLDMCKLNRISTIYPKAISNNLYFTLKNKKINGYIYNIETTDYNIKELNSSIIYLKQKGYKIINLNDLLKE